MAELDQFHLANGERIPRLKDLFQLTEESGYEGQLNLEMKQLGWDWFISVVGAAADMWGWCILERLVCF